VQIFSNSGSFLFILQTVHQNRTELLKHSNSNLKIFSSLEELNMAIPTSTPKLILTVPSTLSYGYARALFVDFSRQPQNLILLTEKTQRGSLSRWLVEEVWEAEQEDGAKYGEGKVGKEVQMDKIVELEVRFFNYSSMSVSTLLNWW